MNRPILLGVTGGIGSGKSTVCRILSSLNVPVYYADDRAKQLLIENKKLREDIINLFGQESYQDGQLNRSYLASTVFNDQAKLEKMNAIVHPAVALDFESFVKKNSAVSIICKEAALLFETASYKQLNKTIAVLASKEQRKKRVLLRDPQRSEEQVEGIMQQQTSDNQRKKLADYLVINDETTLVIPQVLKIYKELLTLAG